MDKLQIDIKLAKLNGTQDDVYQKLVTRRADDSDHASAELAIQ